MICHRCNEPVAFGEDHATLYDAGGQALYMHVVRVAGRLEEHCPQPPATAGSPAPDAEEEG